MVGDPLALLVRNFISDNVQALVDLHFVGIDNFSLETRGQVDGEVWICQFASLLLRTEYFS